MAALPEYVYGTVLPKGKLSVRDLLTYPTPPTRGPPAPLPPGTELFSRESSLINDMKTVRVLLSLPIPTTVQVNHLHEQALKAVEEGFLTFWYPVNTTGDIMRLPFWVITCWQAMHDIIIAKQLFTTATNWLGSRVEVRAFSCLSNALWKGPGVPAKMGGGINSLVDYCSEKWLSSLHMDQMAVILEDRLSEDTTVSIMCVSFFEKLTQLHRHSKAEYTSTPPIKQFYHKIGDDLYNQVYTEIAMSISVVVKTNGPILPSTDCLGNHWVTLIVDVENSTLLYADPLGVAPPVELVQIMQWWLGYYLGEDFLVKTLPCTIQIDSFSCSVLSANAMAHHYLGD
ncbi:hypothetical protein BD779DRAFT_1474583 [Infundibulicybe gibba]|nr:hypothetical protein BD779DRAFT_1474583 [Infundibulicybe gibba]